MAEKTPDQMIREEFLRAIPWAVTFSLATIVTMLICVGIIKQEIKEAFEFGTRTALIQTVAVLTDDEVFNKHILPKLKQNTKEAIEYTMIMARRELLEPALSRAGAKK
jgi:hypothetical protein